MPQTHQDWPEIPFSDWRETAAALHLFLQVVGKYRLARTPWLNHSWHATLYVTSRGLTTSPIPDASGAVEVDFDFGSHEVVARGAEGRIETLKLEPMSVAQFHERFISMIKSIGGNAEFHGRPNEIFDAVAFTDDTATRPYDGAAIARFHQALLRCSEVFQTFRTGFIGKVSPVHLFWGSFDLAVTRFSGRVAPAHPGGIPGLPDEVTSEAYSHEVSSAGFWAGGGPVDEAAFYSYSYPMPDGFADAPVEPSAAYFDTSAGEFILPYRIVRESPDPAATLLSFLESTYQAAARLGHWEEGLTCARGVPGRPRPLS